MAVNTAAYKALKAQLDQKQIVLIAVSKTKSIQEIKTLYDLGQRDFGENYVQELTEKYEALPKDIRWHFIGHLQTNKVKYITPFVFMIHGVDTKKLLMEINRQGAKINRVITCLLQIFISSEETKFGLSEEELREVLTDVSANPGLFDHVAIKGLMGMATFTDDQQLVSAEFGKLEKLFDEFKTRFTGNELQLSMGMSADYMIAIESGTSMVRIGSLLFGERDHPV